MKSRKNKEWVSCDYEVLPDYFIIGDEVANGGYTKRGMYALRGAQAQLLYSRGVPIVALCRDNTNKPIKSEDDLFEHNWLFGVSKAAWREYLNTAEGYIFICARHLVEESAHEIAFGYQKRAGVFLDDWFDEICLRAGNDYEQYLSERSAEYDADFEMGDDQYYQLLRPFIMPLVREYTNFIKVLFMETVFKDVSDANLELELCEEIAKRSDNKLFGYRRTEQGEKK